MLTSGANRFVLSSRKETMNGMMKRWKLCTILFMKECQFYEEVTKSVVPKSLVQCLRTRKEEDWHQRSLAHSTNVE